MRHTSRHLSHITRPEANDVIARHVMLECIRKTTRLTFDVVEAEIQAWKTGSNPGTLGAAWARLASPTTVYRVATQKLTDMGRMDLLPPQSPNQRQRHFLADLAVLGVPTLMDSDIRNTPSDATVVECRANGWVAPYAGRHQDESVGHKAYAPWKITTEGMDALNRTGAYRRTARRDG